LVQKQNRIGPGLDSPPNAQILRGGDAEVVSIAQNLKATRSFNPTFESGCQAAIINDKKISAIDSQKLESLTEARGIRVIGRNHRGDGFELVGAVERKAHRDTRSAFF
jgi:hypothetical protein